MTDKEPTRVIFRRWYTEQDGSGTIALFPDLGERGGMVSSFEHVGQHGAADLAGVIARTRPATPGEYAALKAELEGIPYGYRLDVTLPEIRLRLTAYQADEADHGLGIDAADGNPDWGRLEPAGPQGRGRATLVIFGSQVARDRALYRLTSCRDIALDNTADPYNSAGETLAWSSRARSLSGLVRKLVEAAGGPENFSPDYRRWIRY